MLYFLLKAVTTYRWVLIIAAVVPAVVLMVRAYQRDRIEKESPALLWTLVRGGILSTLLAMVEETVGQWLLGQFVAPEDKLYDIIMFFVIVAFAEETSKYIFMKRSTWNNPEFNCQYDGVIYALFTSLGFALWENISYVLSYGFSTALVRAVTAIPGHASFGVFMGVFYGLAKRADTEGNRSASTVFRVLSILAPALLHGAYDYIATRQTDEGTPYFLIYVVVLFIFAFIATNRASANDVRFGAGQSQK